MRVVRVRGVGMRGVAVSGGGAPAVVHVVAEAANPILSARTTIIAVAVPCIPAVVARACPKVLFASAVRLIGADVAESVLGAAPSIVAVIVACPSA